VITLARPLFFAVSRGTRRTLAPAAKPAIIMLMMRDDPFPAAMPDGALLVAFGNGDMQAAADLIDRLSPRVLSQATRLLGNRAEAEEITQEAMLRLWHAARDWRQGEAQVSTWLYRVTANLCIDRLRARRIAVAIDAVVEPADPAPSVADRLQTDARHRALYDALASLPERQAMAVSLRYIEGLSNPDIAAIMDIGVEAVESLTARGKRALTAMLAGRKDALGYDDDN
jgi:RNA polymerase sigma factor (sigma-70 family)